MQRISLIKIFVASIAFMPTYLLSEPAHHPEHCHYHIIRKFISQYSRKEPITILCLGPILSTVPFQIATTSRSICIMLDGDNSGRLEDLCSKTAANNLILLKTAFTLDHLRQLGECEHFDIVIALNTLDRIPEKHHKEALDLILDLGDNTFIEFSQTTQEAYNSYMPTQGGASIAHMNNRTLWLVAKEKKYLKRRNWGHYEITPPGRYMVVSNFKDKYFVKAARHGGHPGASPWSPGINLKTFKELKGVCPSKELVYNELKTFSKSTVEHNDLAIFNIVIQGKRDSDHALLVPIDANEKGRNARFSSHLRKILREFRSLSRYFMPDIIAELQLPCNAQETDHDELL